MIENLEEKHVLITGGSNGLGLAMARAFSEQGAKITNFDIEDPSLEVDNMTSYKVDVTKSEDIKIATQNINTPIDIVINNAGMVVRGTLLDASEKEFDAVFDTNVKAYWLIIKHLIDKFSKEPTILLISSRHAILHPNDPGVYAWTKMAVNDLHDLLTNLHPEFITKLVIPGPLETRMANIGETAETILQQKPHRADPKLVAEKIVQLTQSSNNKLLVDIHNGEYYFT